MSNSQQTEILSASAAPEVSEKGGGYGQKGVDFQRYWAISKIIELVSSGQPDFLILFESLQDIVEFDHSAHPTRANIYQIKMKEAGEWSWKALTALPPEPRRKPNSKEFTTPPPFGKSPIGKLASTMAELSSVSAQGFFVSNLACTATLERGSTAGSVRLCKFSELSPDLRAQIEPELGKLRKPVNIADLHIHKTELSLEEPHIHASGKVNDFLLKEAPRHAGQCRSFSDSLFATLSARGRQTDDPQSFDELVARCGYTKAEFDKALETLRGIPDYEALIQSWLTSLKHDGMHLVAHTKLQARLTHAIDERLKTGSFPTTAVSEAARSWIAEHPVDGSILECVENGTAYLKSTFPETAKDYLQAMFVLEGINSCLNQN